MIKTILKMETKKQIQLKSEFTNEELKKLSRIPEAAFRDLTRMLERVNSMSEEEVRHKLKSFHVSIQEKSNNYRQLLKDSYKKIIPASINVCLHKDLLPYYVIIDFEATCEKVNSPNYRHEIIEFPAVIVDSNKQVIKDCFQMFCKPQINPVISEFCTNLTGIRQEQIDSAETFDKVLEHFQNWLKKNNLGKKRNYAIVTDGPWDMSRFLYSQCHYSNVNFPAWGENWVNLRKTFSKFYQCEKICLKNMLEFLRMDFKGRPHCGLDDARNIARILLKMIYDGANIQVNERITSARKIKGKAKPCDKGDVNNVSDDKGFDTLNEKNKVEAHYAAVYWLDKVPKYKETRRSRFIAEAQVARALSQNPNILTFGSEYVKSFRKKKNKKSKKDL